MALLKKLPHLLVWSQGYLPATVSRSASSTADTLPRIAWPPQAPSRARTVPRRHVQHPHLAMGVVFLLILLMMLTIYTSRGETRTPYLQVVPQGETVLPQGDAAVQGGTFWHLSAPAGQIQTAPPEPVTGD